MVKLNKPLIQQLKTLVEKLNQIKQERRKKEMRKQTYANPKRLPKRASIIVEIYKKLIKEAEGPTYLHLILRLALCLLALSGVQINERLNIKLSQMKRLTQESWIATDRSKRGPRSHKLFITK